MKGFHQIRLGLVAAAAVAMFAGVVSAQPGDGLPDVYYFNMDGQSTMTSFGEVSRPGGTMLVDTDGTAFDMVAIFIGGPNVTPSGSNTLDLADGDHLPMSSDCFTASTWTVGFSPVGGGSTQWIRTNPLTTDGFKGVIGTGYFTTPGDTQQNHWCADFPPFLDYPTNGLANYGLGLTEDDFLKIFGPGGEGQFSVQIATDDGRSYFTDVTIVPEPATLSLLGMAAVALAGFLRRR
jgi:hypothetical protein